jgi:cell fate regulator YaaT (PSP1 superfamily)
VPLFAQVNQMMEPLTKKAKQAKSKKYMLVRYGRMNALGFFEHNESKIPKVNARVVVKTDKGLELAYLVGQLSAYKAGQFRLSDDQMKKYFDDDSTDFSCNPAGKFVRFATSEDISEERHLQKIAKEEMETCRQFAKELNLPMKIVDTEHIFGGERIIFYFMSDGRVDFRELVKKLSHEYQTRIEMHQIGSRDEAKILGDVETCGQQCCCQRFLKLLKPVNMRMAKMQKATLDPSKISGYCGRLKCCLRYEDKTYTELKKNLPKKNAIVKTKDGQGKVVDSQILTQLVVVEYENGEKDAVPLEELEIISTPATTKKDSDDSAPDAQDDPVDTSEANGRNDRDDKEQ